MDDRQVRVSRNMLKVLKLMIEKPRTPYSGADFGRELGIGAGTLYPLLQRLEHVGWLKSEWEQIEPSEVGRPRRRHYTLTGLGQMNAVRAFAEVQTTAGAIAWNS